MKWLISANVGRVLSAMAKACHTAEHCVQIDELSLTGMVACVKKQSVNGSSPVGAGWITVCASSVPVASRNAESDKFEYKYERSLNSIIDTVVRRRSSWRTSGSVGMFTMRSGNLLKMSRLDTLVNHCVGKAKKWLQKSECTVSNPEIVQ